jgi:hypothetical protein
VYPDRPIGVDPHQAETSARIRSGEHRSIPTGQDRHQSATRDGPIVANRKP